MRNKNKILKAVLNRLSKYSDDQLCEIENESIDLLFISFYELYNPLFDFKKELNNIRNINRNFRLLNKK